MDEFTPTERTQVRNESRADYSREAVEQILDEALWSHVGYVVDGRPYVVPMVHARVGGCLYLHGAPATRLVRTLRTTAPVCVTATLVDGLVLARSAFHHSVNYRSALVVGDARLVTDRDEKEQAFAALVEHVAPGRADECRAPNEAEFRGTAVLAVPIEEASAKVRIGPPADEEADLALDHWAGVLPLRLVPGGPVPSPDLRPGIPVPPHVSGWSR